MLGIVVVRELDWALGRGKTSTSTVGFANVNIYTGSLYSQLKAYSCMARMEYRSFSEMYIGILVLF